MADMTTASPLTAGPVRVPLNEPDYGIAPLPAIGRFFRKYGRFSGRASRAEYWWVVLFIWTVVMALAIPLAAFIRRSAVAWWELIKTAFREGGTTDQSWDQFVTELNVDSLSTAQVGCLIGIGGWLLITMVPISALFCRRLHDAGHSGLWWFLLGVPLVNLLPLVMLIQPASDRGYLFERHRSTRSRPPAEAEAWEVPGFAADADASTWG
jgi:uncharacterized membrane protein YhaH (DUF805 family)